MIQLTYSNRIEALLAALIAELRASRRGSLDAIFAPARIVVPHRSAGVWLKLGMACATGLAANLRLETLPTFLSQLEPALGRERMTRGFEGPLLSLLLDDAALAHAELLPIREYLNPHGSSADARDLRRCQLALQLGGLFEGYAASREELLDAWRKGKAPLEETRFADVERWQRRLFLTLESRTVKQRPIDLALPSKVSLFCPFALPTATLDALEHLSKRMDVHLFALAPAAEFAGDLATAAGKTLPPRATRRVSSLAGDPFDTDAEGLHPGLRRWGRASREALLLLNERADGPVRPAIDAVISETPTLLQRLQRDLASREKPREVPDPQLGADGSLVVLACPGVRRELETIASEIWRMVQEDPSLRFNDIAVLFSGADEEAYLTQLTAVFRECHSLPHSLVELPLSSESRLLEAMLLLLELPLAGFTRDSLLRLATHPAVLAGFPEIDVDEWLGWCDRLAMLHGADREDHAGSYIEKDVFNFDQGIRRLALGAFMTGERSGDERAFLLDGQQYLPEEHPQSSHASAGRFGLLLRSLIEDARFARTASMPLDEWAIFFKQLFEAYLGAGAEQDAAERERIRCYSALQALEDSALGDRPVSFRVASELAKRALGRLRGGKGHAFAEGVVVAPLAALRGLPFEVIFVAGLGERTFPSPDRDDALDLRNAGRRAGDVTPRDRDRATFLDTVLSARRTLALSYVSKHAITGEDLRPSAVVQELQQLLAAGYLMPAELAALERRHPMRRFHPPHFPELQPSLTPELPMVVPEARAEAQALGLRVSVAAALKVKGDLPPLSTLRERLTRPAWDALAQQLSVVSAPPPSDAALGLETLSLSLSALRGFLEDPVQGYARYVLHLREEEDDDVLGREDEPFAPSGLDRMIFLRRVFTEAFPAGTDEALVRSHDAVAESFQLRGKLPTGFFGEVDRGESLEVLGQWKRIVDEHVKPAERVLTTFRYGRAEEHLIVDELHPPLVMELVLERGARRQRHVRIELVGRSEPVLESPAGSLTFVSRSPKRKAQEKVQTRLKLALRGFLDHVVLSALGLSPGKHTAWVCNARSEAPLEDFVTFKPLSRERANEYLQALVSDLLTGSHAFFLPIEAAIESLLDPATPLEARIEEEREKRRISVGRPGYQSWGPVREPEELPAPVNAAARVKQRYGLLIDLWERE